MDPIPPSAGPRAARDRLPTLGELRQQEETLDWEENRRRSESLPLRVKLKIAAVVSMASAFVLRWWDR